MGLAVIAMNASPKLRHRIRLQSASLAPDGGGGGAESWSDLATLWAAIEPQSGGETRAGGGASSLLRHEIVIRHRAGVNAAQRIVFDGRVFRIQAVLNPEERSRYLRILCEEEA